MKSKSFDDRERELISTMDRARNELSAGGGRDVERSTGSLIGSPVKENHAA